MVGQLEKNIGICKKSDEITARNQKKEALIARFLIKGEKKRETLALVGFVISLGGIAISYFGKYYTGVLPIIELFFVFQGYYSKNRFLSKLTVILIIINALIVIVESIKYIFFE